MAMAVIMGFQYPKKIMDLFFLTKGKSATELFLEKHRHNQGPLILIPHIGKFNDRQGCDDVHAHGQKNAPGKTNGAGAVNSGGIQHIAWQILESSQVKQVNLIQQIF